MNDVNTTPRALPTGSSDQPTGGNAPGDPGRPDDSGQDRTTRPNGPSTRLFRRSREDTMIAGICGGAGRALGVDPVLVRLATAALALFGVGIGVLLYVICWVIVPLEDATANPTPPTDPVD